MDRRRCFGPHLRFCDEDVRCSDFMHGLAVAWSLEKDRNFEALAASNTGDLKKMEPRADFPMEDKSFRERIRAFWDFFVLFSGISTARNLSRTRKNPVLSRGLFLFRSKGTK